LRDSQGVILTDQQDDHGVQAITTLLDVLKPMDDATRINVLQFVFKAVCTENLNPNVLTMKSTQYGARIYDARSLNLARDRRILVQ
jgi:hypothetical protein